MIEFDKFLAMMKNDKKHNEGIVSFFKSIMVGDVASMAKRKFRNKTIVL